MAERDDDRRPKAPAKAGRAQVDAFLDQVARMPRVQAPGGRGRLLFALDATASREPTWDRAAHIQAEMFQAAAAVGGLEMQVAFYRGFGEFKATPWTTSSDALLRRMTAVRCLAGETQIRKVLRHALNEARSGRVNAVVFVGDCCEEDVDRLGAVAGELGLLGVPVFLFHEGQDPIAGFAFRQIAKLTGGACCDFDSAAADTLRDLLKAVAVFAAGGRPALEDYARRRGGAVARIAHQIR